MCRICKVCKIEKEFSEFHKHSGFKNGYNSVCKECRKPVSKTQYLTHSHEYKMWYRARNRAKRKGLEFSIELSDIIVPDICPVFLTKLDVPSLDRIDSSKGYIKGNIQVISNRANMLKNNATIEELEAVINHMKGGNCEVK